MNPLKMIFIFAYATMLAPLSSVIAPVDGIRPVTLTHQMNKSIHSTFSTREICVDVSASSANLPLDPSLIEKIVDDSSSGDPPFLHSPFPTTTFITNRFNVTISSADRPFRVCVVRPSPALSLPEKSTPMYDSLQYIISTQDNLPVKLQLPNMTYRPPHPIVARLQTKISSYQVLPDYTPPESPTKLQEMSMLKYQPADLFSNYSSIVWKPLTPLPPLAITDIKININDEYFIEVQLLLIVSFLLLVGIIKVRRKLVKKSRVEEVCEEFKRPSSLLPFIRRNGMLRTSIAPASGTPDQGFEVFLARYGGDSTKKHNAGIARRVPSYQSKIKKKSNRNENHIDYIEFGFLFVFDREEYKKMMPSPLPTIEEEKEFFSSDNQNAAESIEECDFAPAEVDHGHGLDISSDIANSHIEDELRPFQDHPSSSPRNVKLGRGTRVDVKGRIIRFSYRLLA